MYIAVSVVSAHIEETHKRWRLEAHLAEGQTEPVVKDDRFSLEKQQPARDLHWPKEGYRLITDGSVQPAFADTSQFGGLMYVLDLQTGREVWRSDWGNLLATPSGFCFADGMLYCADLEGSSIFAVDLTHEPGRLVRRISNPALNDVHYVTRTRRGLLLASTGTDMVVEMDLDGNSLYEWWAGDYGYTATIGGVERPSGRGAEHRDQYYHTRYQTTHLNAAQYRDAAETRLLVLLWHQGMLVEIDTTQPAAKQVPRPVLTGLSHPHSLKPLPDGGWLIADSQAARLLVLDSQLRVHREIPSVDGWIQDAVALEHDRWLIADVNRFRLGIQDAQGTILEELPFHRNWRVYGVEIIPAELAHAFRSLPAGAGIAAGDHHAAAAAMASLSR